MAKSWTKTEAFESFGVAMENVRWSWSGVSPDGKSVVVVLWQDRVQGRGGELTYADDEDLDAAWRRRPGATARVRHLNHCAEHLDGRFRAVIARARDPHANPRQILECFPQQGVIWQLTSFDPENGAFSAKVLML